MTTQTAATLFLLVVLLYGAAALVEVLPAFP